jgi:hypothetical protein
MRYEPIVEHTPSLEQWRLPGRGEGFDREGMYKVHELTDIKGDTGLLGAFPDSVHAGLFVGTRIPQHHVHTYTASRDGETALTFDCTTTFIESARQATSLSSEETWLCADKRAREALDSYWSHVPHIIPSPQPPVGWNSWDYYFRTVDLDDVIENMEAIRADAVLSDHVRYIVVDDGWQHVDGAWYPNHRFPGGTARLAEEIQQRGFIPGIWTAPLLVDDLCVTAMRHDEILIKDAYGDPQPSGVTNRYMIDPTHPKGQAYLREIFTRLHREGFRFFKLDFVSVLLDAERLYAPDKGPFDALRDLFRLARSCVGNESHILGCSLPAQCGPGCSDSGRINIDIHNHWTHVKWAAEAHQLWNGMYNRVWINDPDFLVVRGPDTSPESVTNVMNPTAHHPDPPRWRRGPDFTLDEARTWATMVAVSGGSVFLSDRIAALNDAGKSLLYKVLEPFGAAARPLDLCHSDHASLWLQERAGEMRLGIVNWEDTTQTKLISFAEHGLVVPTRITELWTGEPVAVENGTVSIILAPHASAILCWSDEIRA